jgi:hypothetical protein
MSTQLEITPEVERRLREIVREELGDLPGSSTHHGLPQSEMRALMDRTTGRSAAQAWGAYEGRPQAEIVAAMERVEELREKIALPIEEVEALLEEHRREFGRG